MKKDWKQIVIKRAESWISKQLTPLPLKELGWRAIVFVAKCGQSNPFSFAVRPLASHKRLRMSLGIILALLVVIGAVSGSISPTYGSDTGGNIEVTVVGEGEVKIETKEAVRQPLETTNVSQKYWLLHPGVDLRAKVGSDIYPVMKGKVTSVKNETHGYGKHVMVEHGNGFESLYAHMSKILVTEGQEVDVDTVLGEVGSTGRSTGPHLHIEVHENGKKVNPAVFLGI